MIEFIKKNGPNVKFEGDLGNAEIIILSLATLDGDLLYL